MFELFKTQVVLLSFLQSEFFEQLDSLLATDWLVPVDAYMEPGFGTHLHELELPIPPLMW